MFRRYPITILIVVLSVLSAASPTITEWMQLDFSKAVEGEWWRWFSGHVTHFDLSHLIWDCGMFAVLSAICESRYRKWYPAILLVSLPLISTGIVISCPEIASYRGLSGIDTMLFTWLGIAAIKNNLRSGDKFLATAAAVGVACMLGKLAYEGITGEILFVNSDRFQPLVEAHIAGAICGAVAACFDWQKTSKPLQIFSKAMQISRERLCHLLGRLTDASARHGSNQGSHASAPADAE